MYCKNCGTKIEEKAKFCRNCGQKVKEEKLKEEKVEKIEITDELLKKEYIGKNYDIIKQKEFSLPAFFLLPYYLFYRKMWLYGFIYLLITILGGVFFIKYTLILILIIRILFGIFFNRLYLQIVNKKIDKIKQKNLDMEKEELLNLVKKIGGVSVISVVLLILLISIISTIICTFFFVKEVINYTDKLVDSSKEQTTSSDGKIGDLSYKLPNGFSEKKYLNDFTTIKNYNGCHIYLTKLASDNKTSKEYLTQKYAEDSISNLSQININNNDWDLLTVNKEDYTNYYYGYLNNDYIYVVRYYLEDNICEKEYKEFINSLSFNTIKNTI